MTSDRSCSLTLTVYLPVRGFIDKAVRSDCVVSLAGSVEDPLNVFATLTF